MSSARSLLSLLAVAAVIAACGKKKEPEPVAPAPTVDSTAIKAKMRQDSIDAANRAAAAAAAAAAARAQAERDSLARVAAARAALVEQLEALVHFDFDKSDIKPEDESNLDTKAAILAANPSLQIQIAGNCDERGSEEYNLALGNRRALAAKRYLTNKGVDPSQITTISNGKERPIAMGHDESSWSMNRNDQFTILSGGDQLVSP